MRPEIGPRVLILAKVWPSEPCLEHGGVGWEGTILSRHGESASVQLRFATPDGRRFAPVRLSMDVLRPFTELVSLADTISDSDSD